MIKNSVINQSEFKAKTPNKSQARENMQPLLSAGKRAREKERLQAATGFGFTPDWLGKQPVCSDWLQHNQLLLTVN